MRLSCPNCLTEYDVPDTALAGRSRSLRCARCGHQWQNAPPAVAASSPVSPAPEHPPSAPAHGFAQSIDEDIRAEIAAAAMTEGRPPLETASQEASTAAGHPSPGTLAVRTDFSPDNNDGTLGASRSRPANMQRASPPRRRGKPLLIALFILFAIGLVVLQRHAVMRAIPASVPLFQAWGFK